MEERLTQLENEVRTLKEMMQRGDLGDSREFSQKIISKDKIFADGQGIKLRSRDNPIGVEIRTGDAINDAGIKAEVGTLPNGSLYLSSSPTQPFFIMVGTTWTLLNIP
jgi:hypothetical protein